jgi:hypothetical protein
MRRYRFISSLSFFLFFERQRGMAREMAERKEERRRGEEEEVKEMMRINLIILKISAREREYSTVWI